MAAAQQVLESPQEKQSVLEMALLHGFCVLMGLLSLAVLVWFIFFYGTISVGTLTMILIDLMLGGVFVALFAWAVYNGEVKQTLDALLKKASKAEQAPSGPAAPTA